MAFSSTATATRAAMPPAVEDFEQHEHEHPLLQEAPS